MTAEVAILNKGAVAVAADSAVTVGKSKVHRTANKLFAVSDHAPIGAMVYGFSEVAGVPWETILKLFRTKHDKKHCETVASLFQEFRDFLGSNLPRTEDDDLRSLARFVIGVIEDLRDSTRLPTKGRTAALKKAIDRKIEYYNGHNDPIIFGDLSSRQFKRDGRGVVETIVRQVFAESEVRVNKELLPRLCELCRQALQSSWFSEFRSGVVFFGFGDDELFPTILTHEVDGFPCGQLRMKHLPEASSTYVDDKATIIPFADRTVMDTLIQLASEQSHRLYNSAMRRALGELAIRVIKDNVILNPDEERVAQELATKTARQIADKYRDLCASYFNETYVNTILTVIEGMPKEDLAIFAQALVEVTALRVKASASVESVGGPIDVCVVTKGDGLVWIKRKHYFDIGLNAQYLYRRFGGIGPLMGGDANDQASPN